MKAQGILTGALGLAGQFLARMLSARKSELDREASRQKVNEASRKKSGENDAPRTRPSDAPTTPGVVIRRVEDAGDALKKQSSRPAMVNPGPVLGLRMMSRNRRPGSHRMRWRELSLPPGCVLAARYASR